MFFLLKPSENLRRTNLQQICGQWGGRPTESGCHRGKDGNKAALLSPFQGKAKNVRELHVFYQQKSLEARLEKVRGFMNLNQTEKIYMVTQKPLTLTERDRLHFDGTNRGNCLGPVAMQTFDDPSVWRLGSKLKKEVIGKTGARILVGGGLSTLGLSPEDLKKISEAPKLQNQEEPVFYHASPPVIGEELMHSYELKAIFALTAGAGDMAMTCLRNRKPFFGICLSEAHKDALLARLEQQVWSAMQAPSDKLYESGLAELLKQSGQAEAEPLEEQKDQKAGRKRTSEGDDKGAGKRPKKQNKDGTSKVHAKAELMKKIADLTGQKGGTKADKDDEDDEEEGSEVE